MPVRKGKGCVKDVMKEWKAGTLHSGKDGEVVKDQKQAIAIALSMCGGAKGSKSYEEMASSLLSQIKALPAKNPEEFDLSEGCGCGDNCDCRSCKAKRRPMAIGYPTPQFEEDDAQHSEDETVEMLMSRLKVIHGLTRDIENALYEAMMMAGDQGEVEMQQWMIDKITLAADYLGAVANESKYGNGIEVEMEDEGREEENGYEEEGLKQACWKGYEAIGMKKKGGAMVPNCVPVGKKK